MDDKMDWETLLSAVTAAERTLGLLTDSKPEMDSLDTDSKPEMDSLDSALEPCGKTTSTTSSTKPAMTNTSKKYRLPGQSPHMNNERLPPCKISAALNANRSVQSDETLSTTSVDPGPNASPDTNCQSVERNISDEELLHELISVVQLKFEIPEKPTSWPPSRKTKKTVVAKRRTKAYSKQWLAGYRQLKKYHAKHGHCMVVRRGPSHEDNKLGEWVNLQRNQYRQYCNSSGYKWLKPRIVKLNKLGFSWNSQEDTWEKYFRTLQAFRTKHGHCNIPREPEYDRLFAWLKHQRRHYCLLKNGKKSQMTEQRVDKLDSVGFASTLFTPTWQKRFEELAEYSRLHGNCDLPANHENTKLVWWARHQRRQYRDKKPDCFRSKLRHEALSSLRFEWGTNRTAKISK